MLFSAQDVLFLKENYSKYGKCYCADKLKLKPSQINTKCRKLQLKINRSTLSNILICAQANALKHHIYNVNVVQFINVTTAEVAYILGLLWADGYLYKPTGSIRIDALKSDIDHYFPIFIKTGNWNMCKRKNSTSGKEMATVNTSNKSLCKHLMHHGYNKKSIESADKILNIIPNHLKHYWFLGYTDGDGCFNINTKNQYSCLTWSSSYDQNWSFLTNVLNNFGIRYHYKQCISKIGHKHSRIIILRKNDIIKFGNYIYKSPNIGLFRKYDKYQKIKKDFLLKHHDGLQC
jgi:hypothetical protein